MLKESIEEMLVAASLCIDFRKENGGCLGYPASMLLLSIVDSIGSYYRGNVNFRIMIDGAEKIIKRPDYQHFYILNSDYYDLQLSENDIRKIYSNYRSLLVHNSVVAINHLITMDDPLQRVYSTDAYKNSVTGECYPVMSLKPFFKTTRFAVGKFIKEIDSVFPYSKQAEDIAKKK